MSITELSISAAGLVIGIILLTIGISYIAYRIKKRSPYNN